jgi:peptidoglycan/xylan/chitin deacetylase (PgdA/CDA1 family)
VPAQPAAVEQRRSGGGLVWRRHLKILLGRLLFGSGVYRAFFKNRAVVVLFHRVDDALAGDPITCTAVAFRTFCRFFRRYFVVVPLGELVDKVRRGEDISRHLAITFDDGYLDNATVAGPELSRLGLPACFFIATGFMDSDHSAPWDQEQGIQSRWMTWDDVRSLQRAGFELGAHTVHHVDLARVAREEAEREISGSRTKLEAEVGKPVRLFSYPFGRMDGITEEARALVRQLGFDCCASAYGGTVSRYDDVFYLRRTPISPWFLSPYQFGFETAVQRSQDAGSVGGRRTQVAGSTAQAASS